MSYMWHAAPNPVRAFLPYGYELGRWRDRSRPGKGSLPRYDSSRQGPTAWFTPIYPYLSAAIFKIWGIFSDESRLIIETLNCAFAALTVIPIYGIAQRTFGKSVAVGRGVGLGLSADLAFLSHHLDLGYGSRGSLPGVDFLGDPGHAGSENHLAVGGLRSAVGCRES